MITKSGSYLRIIYLLAALTVCGVLVFVIVNRIALTGYQNKLEKFAEPLGYTPGAHLAQYQTCWGFAPVECGQVLYYTTLLTKENFQEYIGALAAGAGTPIRTSVANLRDINFVTDHTFTIERDSSNTQLQQSESTGYRWIFEHAGEEWIVVFYDVAGDEYIYTLDGQSIEGNIVTIVLRTK